MPARPPTRRLPDRIEPMLCRPGAAFDAPDFLFEIKWDGTRALAFRDARAYRLQNRKHASLKERYPELSGLHKLKAGTVLDGEVVVLRHGRPDFPALLKREQARTLQRVAAAARTWPATYVVFDLLYDRYLPLLDRPCAERRERLRAVAAALADPRVVMSEGVVGDGRLFFEQAAARGLEGVVAKRLTSPYLPGRRTDHWVKVKRRQTAVCAVIGYQPDPERGLKSLIVAAEFGGALRCVGKVGSGIGEALARRLLAEIPNRRRGRPVVPCSIKGRWLEPGLFCEVSYLELTPDGNFRAPAFVRLIEPPEPQ